MQLRRLDALAASSRHLALSFALLGLLPTASLCHGQTGPTAKLPGRAGSPVAQAANHDAQTPSYSFTIVNFPGAMTTAASGMNLGVANAKIEIVGAGGPEAGGQIAEGFLIRVSGTKTVTETYQTVNDPHISGKQAAIGINDSGQIVGFGADSSGVEHGYERSKGKFTTLNVPFAGATGTQAYAINNAGEIVGTWYDAAGTGHGFTLIADTYTSFDYPGALFTFGFAVNSKGDIVGQYQDTAGWHGYMLSGGSYSSLDFPGATGTFPDGINDADEIVGGYCTTSECASTYYGAQGFLLSNGTYTTIVVPGETTFNFVVGINNDDIMLGLYEDAAEIESSFLATPSGTR
jgi:hypothetical protein